jgi:hypothetical protein
MTTYEDNLLAARFAALAPEPIAGDWADVVERAGVARRSRPRLRRSGLLRRRRRLVVVLAVVAVVAVGAASAIGGVRDFILDRGFLGLPPEGATPSSPENGELVVHYLGRSATHAKGRLVAPLVQLWVYTDGRMLWSEESSGSSRPVPEGASELATGYLEQRLTPAGVELMRSEVGRFFDGSRGAVETLPTDFDPQGGRHYGGSALLIRDPLRSGVRWGSVEVRDGDRFVGLQWVGLGEESQRFEGPVATPEQISALLRIDALLSDPASVLPPSAWAVRKIRAYVPSHYQVCMQTAPPKDDSELLSLLPRRAAELLRDKSRTRLEGDVVASPDGGGPVAVQGRSVTYCSRLATEEARELAESLSGLEHDPRLARLQYRLAAAAPSAHWWEGSELWFEPFFPHGQVTCSVCG